MRVAMRPCPPLYAFAARAMGGVEIRMNTQTGTTWLEWRGQPWGRGEYASLDEAIMDAAADIETPWDLATYPEPERILRTRVTAGSIATLLTLTAIHATLPGMRARTLWPAAL